MITKNTIVLRTAGSNGIESQGPSRYIERNSATGVTVTPGDLLKINSSDKFILPAAGDAGLKLPVIIARENELYGKTVDDTYAAGDRVYAQRLVTNDEVHVRVAAGETVTFGALLALTGTDGTVSVAGTGDIASFEAMEAYDNAAGTGPVLVQARVIEAITAA